MLLNYQQQKPALREANQVTETIFIIHGLFGSLSNLYSLASALQDQHHTILVDLRNHGASPHSQSMSYQDMADDIFELADHLNIESFSIVGHSMGGKVAMTCALLRPERINKIIPADIAPIAYPDKHSDVFTGLHAVANEKIKSRKDADLVLSKYIETPELRQFLLKSLRKTGDYYQFQYNLSALFSNYMSIRGWISSETSFNKEVLFIKGSESDYILPQHQTKILRFFPNAKAKVINNTGHWLHAEKPKAFNRLVSEFFN
jgi:esterase